MRTSVLAPASVPILIGALVWSGCDQEPKLLLPNLDVFCPVTCLSGLHLWFQRLARCARDGIGECLVSISVHVCVVD